MAGELSKIVAADKPKAAAFLEFVSSLDTLEITWMFGMLKDQAEESLQRAEERSMRHAHFGRTKEAEKALDRVEFYKKCIKAREVWQDAEMEHSIPGVIAAIRERHGAKPTPPPRKKTKATATATATGIYHFDLPGVGAVVANSSVVGDSVCWVLQKGAEIYGSAVWEHIETGMKFTNRRNFPSDPILNRDVHHIFDYLLPAKIREATGEKAV